MLTRARTDCHKRDVIPAASFEGFCALDVSRKWSCVHIVQTYWLPSVSVSALVILAVRTIPISSLIPRLLERRALSNTTVRRLCADSEESVLVAATSVIVDPFFAHDEVGRLPVLIGTVETNVIKIAQMKTLDPSES
jgi:hypothetical protein